MDQLTILQSSTTAAKLVRNGRNGQFEFLPVRLSTHFDVEQVEVRNLATLYDQLCQLQADPTKFVVRGDLAQGRPTTGVRRTSRPYGEEPANFTASPRQWLMIDLDGIPLPEKWENFERHTAEVIDHAISLLPPEFLGAACVYQWSGSMGFKTGEIRLHLWFWLEHAVADREAKAWLHASPVDLSVFNAVQPHFTAAPILEEGLEDPVRQRIGLHQPPGYRIAVQPPVDLQKRALVPRHRRHTSAAGKLDPQGISRDPDTGLVIDGRERLMLLKSNDATCELMRGKSGAKDFPNVEEIARLTWQLFSLEAGPLRWSMVLQRCLV